MSVEDFEQAMRRRRVAAHQEQVQAVQHLCEPPGRPYANAKLFLEARYSHIEHPLLVHQGGEWYWWDGACWPVFDQGLCAPSCTNFLRIASIQPEMTRPNRSIRRAAR